MAHLTLWMCASMLVVESTMEPRFLSRSDAGTVAPPTACDRTRGRRYGAGAGMAQVWRGSR